MLHTNRAYEEHMSSTKYLGTLLNNQLINRLGINIPDFRVVGKHELNSNTLPWGIS